LQVDIALSGLGLVKKKGPDVRRQGLF
jgi:hypothetical protein